MINNLKCPICSKSYYTEGSSTCTTVFYQPIYKDGVNINPDRNIQITNYTCLSCGSMWKIKSSYGNPDEVIVLYNSTDEKE